MRRVHRLISESSVLDVAILITGETGTGKDLVARAIHYLGPRRHQRFVKMSCAAVAPDLLEGGNLEAASQGTLFLDEIGDLHLSIQAKLLNILEDGQPSRVGACSSHAEVRVVASTNRDLEPAIAAGLFRRDLFYRLSTIRIEVPPLRQRPEDIPGLIEHFVHRYCALYQREPITVNPEAILRLAQYPFPGNVRELENMVKRVVLLRTLDLAPITGNAHDGHPRPARSRQRTRFALGPLRVVSQKAAQTAERRAIRAALEVSRWNRRRAAQLLNVSYGSLLHKIKMAGLDDIGQKAPNLS